MNSKKHLYGNLVVVLLLACPNIMSQEIKEKEYPKADIHIGISLVKGSYIGTLWQLADKFYIEASYGRDIGFLLLTPGEDKQIINVGVDYYLQYFLLNLAYSYFEEIDSYFSHIASLNIQLVSLDEPGFHLIGAVGGFYEIGKFYSEKPKKAGVNFNLAIGFRIL